MKIKKSAKRVTRPRASSTTPTRKTATRAKAAASKTSAKKAPAPVKANGKAAPKEAPQQWYTHPDSRQKVHRPLTNPVKVGDMVAFMSGQRKVADIAKDGEIIFSKVVGGTPAAEKPAPGQSPSQSAAAAKSGPTGKPYDGGPVVLGSITCFTGPCDVKVDGTPCTLANLAAHLATHKGLRPSLQIEVNGGNGELVGAIGRIAQPAPKK